VLLHPNFENEDAQEEQLNHTERAVWMGERMPLDLRVFDLMKQREREKQS